MDTTTALLVLFFIFSLLVSGGVGGFFYWINEKKKKAREDMSIDSVLLQIAVPKNNEIKIDAMDQFFSALAAIKEKTPPLNSKVAPSVSFEIVARAEDIKFYIWTPIKYRDLIEKQVHGAYPDAEILEVQEYNIFTEHGKVAYKELQLDKENYYPIKTFKDLPTDPLASLTSALAKMGKDESAAIQVLVRAADSGWQKQGSGYISQTKKQESDPEKAKHSVSSKELEAVENKISKLGLETTIRIVVVANDQGVADAHLTNINSTFAQFSSDLNRFSSKSIRNKGAFVEDFLYRYQPVWDIMNKASILNSEELATVFHFPNKQITTPHIHWLYSKTAPAPAQIPTEGLFLGTSTYRGTSRPVYISDFDRQRHMYIIGKTGTGKSEFLKDLIM